MKIWNRKNEAVVTQGNGETKHFVLWVQSPFGTIKYFYFRALVRRQSAALSFTIQHAMSRNCKSEERLDLDFLWIFTNKNENLLIIYYFVFWQKSHAASGLGGNAQLVDISPPERYKGGHTAGTEQGQPRLANSASARRPAPRQQARYYTGYEEN